MYDVIKMDVRIYYYYLNNYSPGWHPCLDVAVELTSRAKPERKPWPSKLGIGRWTNLLRKNHRYVSPTSSLGSEWDYTEQD